LKRKEKSTATIEFASSENNYMTLQFRTVATAAVASAAHLSNVKAEERLGSLVRRDDYFRPTFRQANCPVVGTVDNNRCASRGSFR
jgi:hypothetical protein